MAITVTPLLTTLFSAEAAETTSWTNESGTDTEDYVEGAASITAKTRNQTKDIYYSLSTTTSLQTTHVYIWAKTSAGQQLDVESNGGIAIYMADSSANAGYWNVAGRDTYDGSWQCFVVDTTVSPDSNNGSDPTMSLIDDVGISFTVGIFKNLDNCWIDVGRYGSGLQITSAATDGITFEDIYTTDISTTNAYGIISKRSGVYFVQGELIFGSTTAGQHIDFADTNKIVVFRDDRITNATLYQLTIEGNATGTINFELGTSSGSGDSMLGLQGCVVKAADATQAYGINFDDANIDILGLYGCSFVNAAAIDFGNTSTALGGSGSTVEIVDCIVDNSDRITYNISSSATTVENRNKVVANDDTTASIEIVNPNTIDGDDWSIIDQDGFKAYDDAATETITISNHDFAANDRFLYVNNDKTFDVVNPTWTVTTGDQTDITFENATNNIVNEKFSLDLTIQTKTGTAIQYVITAIFEGTQNDDIPADNYQITDVSGEASSNILKRTFVDSGGGASLSETVYGDYALKVYRYTYGPFVGALTVTAAIDQTITLIADTAITESDQDTAIQDGRGITVTDLATVPLIVIAYDDANNPGNNVLFATDDTLQETTSGDTGTVVEVAGNAASGTIVIRPDDSGDTFTDNETLNGTGGSSGECTVDKATTDDTFTWEVDCQSNVMTEVYDYLAAKMAQETYITAQAYDGGAYTNETTEAKDESTGDMELLPSGGVAQNDAYYFGSEYEFSELELNISATDAAPTSTIVWEYSTSGGWSTCVGLTDNTTGLTATGTNTVTWTIQADWAATAVNSITKYWIRVRESNAGPSWSPSPSGTQAKIDTIFEDTYIWGEDEQSQLLYSGASGYYTERNVNLTEGVFHSDRGSGTIDYFTADDGATFTPSQSVDLEINGVVLNTQCYIVPTAGGTAILNSAATTVVAGNEYKATTTHVYTGDVAVTVRAREMGYLPFETSSTITTSDLAITAIWLVDPNWKLVVSGENIAFTNPDTITRIGNFTTDGWLVVMGQVTVEGSATNDGTYTITAVGTTTVTVSSGISTAGAAAGITLTYTRRTPDW